MFGVINYGYFFNSINIFSFIVTIFFFFNSFTFCKDFLTRSYIPFFNKIMDQTLRLGNF